MLKTIKVRYHIAPDSLFVLFFGIQENFAQPELAGLGCWH